MRDVLHVEGEPFRPVKGVSAADLGQASEAWAHLEPAVFVAAESIPVGHWKWARPHQSDIAAQNVPQRRQLVEAARAQESPETTETFGVVLWPVSPRRSVAHRPELEQHERMPTATQSLLAKQHTTAESNADEQSKYDEDGSADRETNRCGGDVDGSSNQLGDRLGAR